MKRTCLMLTVLAGLLVVPLVAAGQEPQTFARYVPEGAVFYATTQNAEAFWTKIEQSNFWVRFTQLKVWEGVDFAWYDDFRREFADKFGFAFDTKNLMAVLGREFAVALYVEPPADPASNARIELLCAARMNPRDAVEGMVEKLLDRAKTEGAENVLLTSVEHRGTKIQSVKTKDNVPPLELRFAMEGDVLLVGIANGVPRIEACLDCLAGEGTPLAGAKDFQRLMQLAHQDHGTFLGEMYVSFEALHQMVEAHVTENPALDPLGNMLKMLTGSARTMAVTTHLDRGLRIKFVAEPGPAIEEMMALWGKAEPAAATHAKYVRPDAIIYYGINSMPPLGELWPQIMNMYAQMGLGIDEKIAQAIEKVETTLDIDFKADVLDIIGPEMAFVLEGLDMEAAPFPFPKLTVLLQVKDKAKAEALIGKIVDLVETAAPEEIVSEVTDLTHEGAALKVFHVSVPMLQINLTPTIGISENFLVISTSEAYAKATLDAAKGGSSLLDSAFYRSLDIPEKTNAVVVLNIDELLKAARQVAQWVVTMAEMQGAGEAAKQRVDDTVVPLLDCLSVLKAIAVYSVVTPDGPVGVYIIRAEDLPAN